MNRPLSVRVAEWNPLLVPAVYSLEAEIRDAHVLLDEIGVPLLVGERSDLVVRLRALRDWITEKHGVYNISEPMRGDKS